MLACAVLIQLQVFTLLSNRLLENWMSRYCSYIHYIENTNSLVGFSAHFAAAETWKNVCLRFSCTAEGSFLEKQHVRKFYINAWARVALETRCTKQFEVLSNVIWKFIRSISLPSKMSKNKACSSEGTLFLDTRKPRFWHPRWPPESPERDRKLIL